MNFGQRLKLLRTKKKISQKILGKVLGMSQESISFYENEKREPDLNTLKKMAEFFGVSLDYLLGMDTSYIINPDNMPQAVAGLGLHDLTLEELSDIKKYISFIKSKR